MENNNLNNLPPFYVGQKVVANCTFKNIVKGQIYEVYRIGIDCNCGYVVGLNLSPTVYNSNAIFRKGEICNCIDCNIKYYHSGYDGYLASRFSPLQESVFPSLTMSKVIEKESQLISMN